MTIILPPAETIVVNALFFCLAIQVFYYLFFYLRVHFIKDRKKQISTEPVSVIICARDAGDLLAKNLPLVLEQEYREYEVIVVNDSSADETEFLLMNLQKKYKHLRFTSLVEDAKFKHGKKLALTVGIKSAKYETLLLTDADCFPASKHWLSNMVSNFTDKKEIVLGYGAYSPQKGLLDKIIRYDTLFIAMNYFSFAHAGLAYMGVGRNLAYKKSTFWKNKGFDSHYFLKSGDDDLFVNEVANSKNVAFELSKDSFTYSEQKSSFKDWYFQKKRHSITSKLYKFKHKLLLGLEPLTRSLLFLLFIVFFANHFTMYRNILLAALLFRMALQLLTVKLSMNKLNERNLLLYSPIIDFLLPIFYFLLLFTKKNSYYYNRKWK